MRIFIKRSWLFGLVFIISAGVVSATELAYVTNEKDNNISVIDLKDLRVLRTIDVGLRPRGIVFDQKKSLAYICVSRANRIDILDLKSEKIIGHFSNIDDPETIVLHPDGQTIYVANEDQAKLSVLDVKQRKIISQIDVGVEPEGLAISPDGRLVVVTSETSNMVHWIDTATNKIIDNTLVKQRPRAAEFTDDGKLLWVSAEVGGIVTILDTASHKVVKELSFEIAGVDRVQPVGIKLTKDGRYAFVALGPGNHVAVVNRHNYTVEKYLPVGKRVWQLAFNQQQTKLLSTNGVSGDISVIDVKKLEVIKTIKVGRFPWGVAIRHLE